MTEPCVVVVHGAGSSPDVAKAAFAGTVATSALHSWWLQGHGPHPVPSQGGDSVGDLADLTAAIGSHQPTTLAGISYGAHLAARWAGAQHGDTGPVRHLILMLPAWTGAAGQVAAMTAKQANAFDAVGVSAELARIVRGHPGWVAEALAASWPQHRAEPLSAALRAIAASSGPSDEELAAIRLPTTVVVSADDPLHPAAVGAHWATRIPAAHLVVLRPTALADLGAGGWRAFGHEGSPPAEISLTTRYGAADHPESSR